MGVLGRRVVSRGSGYGRVGDRMGGLWGGREGGNIRGRIEEWG